MNNSWKTCYRDGTFNTKSLMGKLYRETIDPTKRNQKRQSWNSSQIHSKCTGSILIRRRLSSAFKVSDRLSPAAVIAYFFQLLLQHMNTLFLCVENARNAVEGSWSRRSSSSTGRTRWCRGSTDIRRWNSLRCVVLVGCTRHEMSRQLSLHCSATVFALAVSLLLQKRIQYN